VRLDDAILGGSGLRLGAGLVQLGGVLAAGGLLLGGVGLGDGVLGVEPLALQLRHQRVDVAVVAPVLEADRAVLADGEVADLVGEGRRAQVLLSRKKIGKARGDMIE
jgi:hypothetical protein